MSEPIPRIILGKYNLDVKPSHSLQLYIGLHAVARDSKTRFLQQMIPNYHAKASLFQTLLAAESSTINFIIFCVALLLRILYLNNG